MELTTQQVEIYKHNETHHTVVVKNPVKANKINNWLKTYDVKIIAGEEPKFKIINSDMDKAFQILGIKIPFRN